MKVFGLLFLQTTLKTSDKTLLIIILIKKLLTFEYETSVLSYYLTKLQAKTLYLRTCCLRQTMCGKAFP